MLHLLYDSPDDAEQEQTPDDAESGGPRPGRTSSGNDVEAPTDQTPLLERNGSQPGHVSKPPNHVATPPGTNTAGSALSRLQPAKDPTRPLAGLNALEIAAVASAKKFLGQRLVQKVVQDIWDGEIIFWESVSVTAVKKARVYNKR